MFMVVDWFGWGFWSASAGLLEVRRISYIQLQEQFWIKKMCCLFFFLNAAQIHKSIYLADIHISIQSLRQAVPQWYLGS